MNQRIEKTLELNKKTQDQWAEIFSKIVAGGLPLDKPYEKLQESSISDLNDRLTATFLLVDSLRSIEEGGAALITPRLKAIDDALGQIQQQCNTLLGPTSGFPDGYSLNDSNGNLQIQVMSAGSAVNTWGLHAALPTVGNQQMALFDQMTLALRFRKFRGVGLFLEKSKELQSMARELSDLLSASKPLAAELQLLLDSSKLAVSQVGSEQKKSTELREDLEKMIPVAQAKADEIEAKLARTKEITKASESLNKQVADYASSFKAFQASIDGRVEAHKKFEQDAKDAEEQLKVRETEIDRLLEKSDAMIKGATSAGLASSLDEARAEYEKRLRWTGIGFLLSIVILFICALPIFAQLVPGPWQAWLAMGQENGPDPWLSMVGKIIILLPATWATAFFAGNYAELFHLSREYAHKAAMAKAVDGFKREAPEYREEIVAGVFMEISDNPGSRKGPEPAAPQNPFTKGVMAKVLEGIKNKPRDSTKN